MEEELQQLKGEIDGLRKLVESLRVDENSENVFGQEFVLEETKAVGSPEIETLVADPTGVEVAAKFDGYLRKVVAGTVYYIPYYD